MSFLTVKGLGGKRAQIELKTSVTSALTPRTALQPERCDGAAATASLLLQGRHSFLILQRKRTALQPQPHTARTALKPRTQTPHIKSVWLRTRITLPVHSSNNTCSGYKTRSGRFNLCTGHTPSHTLTCLWIYTYAIAVRSHVLWIKRILARAHAQD